MNEMLTVEQIERKAERMMDTLDRALMRGDMSQETYDVEVKGIDDWAKEQYKILERNRSSI